MTNRELWGTAQLKTFVFATCTCASLLFAQPYLALSCFGSWSGIPATALCLKPTRCGTMPRRPYQDYHSWLAYGTKQWWDDVEAAPHLAMEMSCQRLRLAGLVNPSEQTSAHVAAAIACMTHGTCAPLLAQSELQKIYDNVKAWQLGGPLHTYRRYNMV